MLKKLFLITALISIGNTATYSVVVDIKERKVNGKSWDVFGNAPDIILKIDGDTLPLIESCKNQYRCVMEFESIVTDWYIEVYDKDKMADDIIGRGNCTVGEVCEVGQAKMIIQLNSENN